MSAGRTAGELKGSPRPTHMRWAILGLLFLISVITYIDRVNISVAAKHMMPAMDLSPIDMGKVFSAFVLAYALFQIPGGWLGDRFGPRRVLTGAVLWWSVFTALTAWAAVLPTATYLGTLGSLMLVRFLIGMGEAAALPNFNRTVANWLGPRERGFGMGLSIGGLGIGSALTPPLTAWIMLTYNWQTAFLVAGVAGLVVAVAWHLASTDHPEDHSRVNAAELAIIKGQKLETSERSDARPSVPWRAIARCPSVWLLTLSYTCLGYVAYVYMSWFYLYLVNVRGFDVLQGAFFAAGPFLAITILCPLGGWASDRLCEWWGVTRGRASVGCLGMLLAAALIAIGVRVPEPYTAIILLSLGAGCLYFPVGAYWASTIDLSKSHAGTLSGIMNTGANLGGTISPTLTPWLAERLSWTAALEVAAGIAVIGAVLWLFVKAGTPLQERAYT